MAVSRLLPSGGANDFNLSLTATFTSVTLNKEYASGSYSIISNSADATFDIYAYNTDGSLAGYTKTGSFTATKGFNKIVVLGGTTGDVMSFTYKTTFTTADDSDEVTAGPVATSVSPSAVPKINDTFTLTGRNFATNCTVTFSSTTGVYTSTQAKSIVRSSATSLIVTRPDNLPVGNSPYTITVENPGVTNPTGSNSHILSNSITAGSAPVWVTGATLTYTISSATTLTLSATDADAGSAITYSIVSGTLPTGLSLNGSTGAITGTPTTSNTTVTFRATDAGGNYVDKAILFNASPVWTTAAGALTKYVPGVAYSTTVTATDDNTAVSYSVVSGALPTGLSLNSSTGAITGTTNDSATASFTIRATDTYGGTADRAFSIASVTAVVQSYTTVGSTTFTLPSTAISTVSYLVVAGGGGGGDGNAAGGGGGAGGMIEGVYTLSPGSSYSVTVGSGGVGNGDNNTRQATKGGNSVFHTATAYGGGPAGSEYGNDVNGSGVKHAGAGGSGGGGSGPNPSMNNGAGATIGSVPGGATGYGNSGANYSGNGGSWGSGGGGGGAGSAGNNSYGGSGGIWFGGGGSGRANSITGSSVTYATGGNGASGSNSGIASNQNGAANTGQGGSGCLDYRGGDGGSGIVVVKYYV